MEMDNNQQGLEIIQGLKKIFGKKNIAISLDFLSNRKIEVFIIHSLYGSRTFVFSSEKESVEVFVKRISIKTFELHTTNVLERIELGNRKMKSI